MLECSIFNCKKEGVVASDQSGYGLINALAVCMIFLDSVKRLKGHGEKVSKQERQNVVEIVVGVLHMLLAAPRAEQYKALQANTGPLSH